MMRYAKFEVGPVVLEKKKKMWKVYDNDYIYNVIPIKGNSFVPTNFSAWALKMKRRLRDHETILTFTFKSLLNH